MGVESATAKASDRIWAEVSGLPSGKRERRLFMVLQAAIDDSGNAPDQGHLVLAGFLSTAERWALFADEWQAVLDWEPRLAYFKYSDATNLRGQFDPSKGWDANKRNARVEALVEVIKAHAIARFHVGVKHSDFEMYVREVPVPQRKLVTDHPYIIMAGRLVAAVGTILHHKGLTEVCDFYFDTQKGYDAELVAAWPLVRVLFSEAPPEILKGAPPPAIGQPTFRDEQDFNPIQAADLLAGMVREAATTSQALYCFRGIGDIDANGLILENEDVAKMRPILLAASQRFRAINPDAELIPYENAKSAARKRKLARKGPRPSGRPKAS